MDFADQLVEFANKIPKLIEHIKTEEATKSALVMPFINILGYNVFNPQEVIPEFTADVGIKKGERVDYAIFNEGKCLMLFECKPLGTNLGTEHMSQLFRYFTVTDFRIGILTNGTKYRLFTDLESPNKMDDKPFLEVDLLNLNDVHIAELKKLTKTKFNLDEIVTSASELKYTKEIKNILSDQLTNPCDEFVKLFATRIHTGRLTQTVKEQLTEIVKKAFNQFINDKINDRLNAALVPDEIPPASAEPESKPAEENLIVTTQIELEGYLIIKSILREVVEPKRICMRDTQSYCGILLDDNNRKPLIRMRFNSANKHIGILRQDKSELKIKIDDLDDIYTYADQIKETITFYENEK
jgi:hypothetical protein